VSVDTNDESWPLLAAKAADATSAASNGTT
jgi:hypothetical protein